MRSKILRGLARLASCCLCACASLQLVGCGYWPSSSMSSPSAPVTNSSTVASGPILGYWWDSTAGGIRPVFGVAGAAYQGAISYNDGTYTGAAICAQKSLALLTGKNGSLSLAALPNGAPIVVAAQNLSKRQVLFSPSCTTALEYASDGSGAVLITGLPSSPLSKIVTLPTAGAILGAAVADSGSILTAAGRVDGSVAVQVQTSAGGLASTVTSLSQFGGMAFLPNVDTAVIADAGKNAVLLATQVGGNMSLAQVAGTADGVAHPLAVSTSADGRAAVVLNQAAQSTLLRIDLSGQAAAVKVVCQCSATELQALRGNLVFRLTEPGSGLVWAFDGDSPSSRVVFIPADQHASVAGVR